MGGLVASLGDVKKTWGTFSLKIEFYLSKQLSREEGNDAQKGVF
jgi:hypothetical protein